MREAAQQAGDSDRMQLWAGQSPVGTESTSRDHRSTVVERRIAATVVIGRPSSHQLPTGNSPQPDKGRFAGPFAQNQCEPTDRTRTIHWK